MKTALHLAPHPDDEALGAPATLLLLRRAGWRVVNAVVSLGRPADHNRRRVEAEEAARRGGFQLVLPGEPFDISSADDLEQSEGRIAEWLQTLFVRENPSIVLSPSPQDGHHGHEVVARAAGRAVASVTEPIAWWVWGLWADLPLPTVYVPFDGGLLAEAAHVLRSYVGEMARNDYDRLLEARAVASAVLGSERVFGFGTKRASSAPYAEVVTELWHTGSAWHVGKPRTLDLEEPVPAIPPTGADVTWWVTGVSPRQRLRR